MPSCRRAGLKLGRCPEPKIPRTEGRFPLSRNVLGYSPRALASILTCVFLWAIAFPVLRVGLQYFPPVTMAFMRYALTAAPVLLYIHKRYGILHSVRKLAPDLHLLLGLAAFSVAVPNVTQNMGLWRNESSSLTAILQASSPAFSVLLASLILGERVGWKKVVGIVVAITSTSLLAVGDLSFEGAAEEGNLLVLASSISYGLAGIFAKTLLTRHPPGLVVSWSFLLGALLIFPALPLDAGLTVDLTPKAWAILLFLAFLPGLLASFLFYWVLQGQDLSRLVFFVYLIPLLAAIPSILFLEETVTLRMAFLGLLTILGVAIAQYETPSDRMRLPQA